MWKILMEGLFWNMSARIELDEKTKKFVTKGNVTEQGILKFFLGVHEPEELLEMNELKPEHILNVISFSSKRKRGSCVVQTSANTVRLYTKGAPEMLF